MVDMGVEIKIMTKMEATKLVLRYSPNNSHLSTINVALTPMCKVAHGVSMTSDEWHGKLNFNVSPLDLFKKILGQ